MTRRSTPLLIAVFSLGSATPSPAALAQPSALETAIRAYATEHEFNGTVLVEQKRSTTYHESFGIADRALMR